MTATSRSLSFALKSATVRSSSGRFLRELLANERLPQDELQARQDHAARAIAEHAMQESPFYRRLYGERGIDPRILDDPRRWAELPILDRATVKAHSGEFATPEAVGRSVRTALTGGSTGEPLRTLHDARVPSLALAWRMYSWWGIQPYDDLARIGRWSFGRMDAVKNTIAWWPTRQLSLDAAVISEETMTEFHRAVTRVRPRLLEGYVGALLELADFLERRGLRIPAPTAVATTAAPLTAPVRARLEDAFEAPVHDEYRGSEFGWMAGECDRQDGLHIFSDVRRIEVVDADGRPAPPGEEGDLVITDLRNRVFPMLRYRNGDRGILRERSCPCGRSLPLMEPPQGRTIDVLHLPSGASLAHRLTALFSAHPESVRLFQIHQQADASLTIRVVPGPGERSRRHVEDAVEDLRTRIRHEVPVRIEYVESLPYTGGKTKYILSDLPAVVPQAPTPPPDTPSVRA